MKLGKLTPLALSLVMILAACAVPATPQVPEPTATPQPPAPVTEDDLVGPLWQWTALVETAPAGQSVVPNPGSYTVQFFANSSVSIQADCNLAQGRYILRRSTLFIELGPATLAFCGEESLDQQFLGLLTQVDSGIMVDGGLRLLLADGAGHMDFRAASALGFGPEDIELDTQELPYSWQAVLVSETPYDESQPPGAVGMPEHIQILFGVTDPADRQPTDPIMYIIPVNAYREQWEDAGNQAVTTTMERIEALAFSPTPPEDYRGVPVLPFEQLSGVNDLAVQFGLAIPAGELNTTSAAQTGYRFVGRWAQDANPVTSDGLPLWYVYQGFTNDGSALVSFWYPVTSAALPTNAEVQTEFEEALGQEGGAQAFIQAQAEELNSLETSDWEPDLVTLDGVVASLQIEGMAVAGIQDTTWLWLEGPAEPGSSEIVQIDDPLRYQVTYGSDGNISFVADCNRGSMSYELSEGGMAGGMLAQPGPMTLAECEPGSYYSAFVNSIMASQDYRVRAGGEYMELVLPAGGGVLTLVDSAVYEPGPEAAPTPAPTATPAPEATATPLLTPTPPAVIQFSADPTAIQAGQCTTLSWRVENVQSVWVYPQGANYLDFPVTGQGSREECPAQTTTYEMRVLLNDGSTELRQVTVQVQAAPAPIIEFNASPTTIDEGQCTTLSWRVENVQSVWVYPQGANYEDFPVTGQDSREECPTQTTIYEMRVLLNGGTTELRQVTVVVNPSNPLAGTSWTLSSLYVNQVPIPDTALTLAFDGEGNVNGNGGCNQFSGTYTVSGATLLIGGITATRVSCGPEIDQQEQLYFQTLQQASRYELGDQLVIFDATGQEILRYSPSS